MLFPLHHAKIFDVSLGFSNLLDNQIHRREETPRSCGK